MLSSTALFTGRTIAVKSAPDAPCCTRNSSGGNSPGTLLLARMKLLEHHRRAFCPFSRNSRSTSRRRIPEQNGGCHAHARAPTAPPPKVRGQRGNSQRAFRWRRRPPQRAPSRPLGPTRGRGGRISFLLRWQWRLAGQEGRRYLRHHRPRRERERAALAAFLLAR